MYMHVPYGLYSTNCPITYITFHYEMQHKYNVRRIDGPELVSVPESLVPLSQNQTGQFGYIKCCYDCHLSKLV